MTIALLSSVLLPVYFALLAVALFCSHRSNRWRIAEIALSINLCVAFASLLLSFFQTTSLYAATLMTAAPLNMLMLTLISFIGIVVLRYSRSNLANDADDERFLRWYLATVLAVAVTVTANQLILFTLSWIGISLCLHNLLLFYPERPRAKLAVHKKFLFARFSEILLIIAFLLLYAEHQTMNIDAILAAYGANQGLAWTSQVAALLLAAVALIKCAQLPLHGWLIQVVEAPTPVSALLHAGIINLGGFLLLLFAPLFSLALAAQWLVLVVAGLSTVAAALIMSTRISIKVKLAWSTSAQMGLMLVQCALGLYELALLHLLAHSCYKAYAFLSAGEAVNDYLRAAYSRTILPGKREWTFALLATVSTLSLGAALYYSVAGTVTALTPWVVLAIAMLWYFANASQSRINVLLSSGFVVLLGFAAYLTLKSLFPLMLQDLPMALNIWADIWISGLFITLFSIYLALQYRPERQPSRTLFIALNAGFYLDEWASRLTMKIWPVAIPLTSRKKAISTTEVIYE